MDQCRTDWSADDINGAPCSSQRRWWGSVASSDGRALGRLRRTGCGVPALVPPRGPAAHEIGPTEAGAGQGGGGRRRRRLVRDRVEVDVPRSQRRPPDLTGQLGPHQLAPGRRRAPGPARLVQRAAFSSGSSTCSANQLLHPVLLRLHAATPASDRHRLHRQRLGHVARKYARDHQGTNERHPRQTRAPGLQLLCIRRRRW